MGDQHVMSDTTKACHLVARRLGTATTAVVAVVVSLASVAWACTSFMGPIKICSPSTGTCTDEDAGTVGRGAEGTTVKVRSTLKPEPAKYALYFGVPGSCHSTTRIMKNPAGVKLKAMTTNGAGELDRNLDMAGVQPYKAVLPDVGSTPGEYSREICAREVSPVPEQTASYHGAFTVVVL